MILFRPVGKAELELINAADMRRFPPRLPEQPIFYPVLDRSYAAEIASQWNTKDAAAGYVGYVTRFEVLDRFLERYEVHTVGAQRHREFWIPAEDLDAFNDAIVGAIEVVDAFHGEEGS